MDPEPSGGGKLKLVLSREDEPAQQVHVEYEAYAYQGPVGTEEPGVWLFAEFNPTTILTGNNVYPATIADPETGEINEIPSSQPRFLITAYRMGFHLLEQLAQQAALIREKLFSRRTWQGDRGRRRPCHPQPVVRLLAVVRRLDVPASPRGAV